jgi:hypothetical protein
MTKRVLKREPPSDYHLLDLGTGVSYGGFASLAATRLAARQRGLGSWQIFHGNEKVEHHDPASVALVARGLG